MPGHKRQRKLFDFNKAFVGDEDFFNKLVNKPFDNSVNELNEDKEISVHVNNQYDPFDIDITEINGFDDLHHPEGIIKAAMENASDFFGTRATFFLVNGSSCGILSAITAVTNIGDTIILGRNCHKSAYNAVQLRDLNVEYVYPEIVEGFNISGGYKPEEIEQKFVEAEKKNIKVKAVVITSPTYEGIVSDIKKIAEIVHGHNSILIVDEAHKIEDGNRGILLQQKIEDVVKANSSIKVFFSSPFTSNPEILLDNVMNNSRKCMVNTQFVAVNQNLLYVSQVHRKIREWQIHLCTIEKTILLGRIIMTDRPTTERHKIVHTAYQTSNKGGCLIYSNGAADAEDTATLLYDLLPEREPDTEITALVELVQSTIHTQYVLARVLSKGIAFHYGNMPLLIRNEIERLFSIGKIEYLVCTSTLLEGVNLPAKSIIIRKPTRGQGNPLNQNDFWNLAGRAGRLGKEYSGNIFCIEPSKWSVQPEPNKTKQEIKRALNVIENKGEELLNYIRHESPRQDAEKRPDLEFAFGYFYIRYVLEEETAPLNPFYNELMTELYSIQSKITLPSSIIKKNPGISPLAQQKLYNFFTEHIDEIDTLIPVYPNDTNAFEEYKNLIDIIGRTISYYPPQLNASRAILLINWMSGKPLSYLIRKSYESYKRNHYNKKLPAVIREVMENVESFVRYQFAKDSSCYIDILRYVLEINNKQELMESIPQLNLWLEFGVSQKTHLSLLALGLSRNTVLELTKYIISTKKSKDECLEWLRSLDLDELELSPIIIDDIKKVL